MNKRKLIATITLLGAMGVIVAAMLLFVFLLASLSEGQAITAVTVSILIYMYVAMPKTVVDSIMKKFYNK